MILVFYLFCIQSSPFFLFVCCKKGKIQRQESQRYRLNLRSLLLLEGYFRVMKPFDSILPSAVVSPWPEMQTVRLSVWRNHPLSHECPLLWWVLESYEIELLLSGKILRTGRTRQTLWRAVQMLTQKLCCQTIHDCPKVVPLHYESE